MFEATLHHRDPEAALRWIAAVMVVLLGGSASLVLGVLIAGLAAFVRSVLAWLLLLFGVADPWLEVPVLPETVEVVTVDIDEREWVSVQDAAVAAEPEDLLGDGPPAPPPEEEELQEPPSMVRHRVALRDVAGEARAMGLLAVIGTTGDSGGLNDLWSGGGADLSEVLSGSVGVGTISGGSGGLGVASAGSGGGGRGEAIGTIGGEGRIGGLAASVVKARGTTSLLEAGAAAVTCRGRRAGDAGVRWGSCPEALRARAIELARPRLEGLPGGGQRVEVVLRPAG